jgi:hypothetical protein
MHTEQSRLTLVLETLSDLTAIPGIEAQLRAQQYQ